MWVPQYSGQGQPVYLMIADALEHDIAAGRLAAGERLPTLKDLAETLKVTPGTIGRAYDEAAKRALVVGEVGRGTFVLQQKGSSAQAASARTVVDRREGGPIDLSITKPNDANTTDWLRRSSGEASAEAFSTPMMSLSGPKIGAALPLAIFLMLAAPA